MEHLSLDGRCLAPPNTEEKLRVLQQRLELGGDLFRKDDATWDECGDDTRFKLLDTGSESEPKRQSERRLFRLHLDE